MAYSTSNPPTLQSQAIAGGSHWRYASPDVHTDVDASGYFTIGYALGMRAGDTMHVIEADSSFAQTTHSVTAVTVGGAATISAAT